MNRSPDRSYSCALFYGNKEQHSYAAPHVRIALLPCTVRVS